MDINCTLILQGIHFGIAYVLLRTLLFKPSITIIREEERQQHALQESIDSRKATLLVKEQEKQQRWIAFQQQYKTVVPRIYGMEDITHLTLPSVTYPVVTKAQAQALTGDVATSL